MTSAMISQPLKTDEVETPAPIREAETPLATEEKMIITDAIKCEDIFKEPDTREQADKSGWFTRKYHNS